MNEILKIRLLILSILLMPVTGMAAEQWKVFETSFTSSKEYENPYTEVEVDVLFSNGKQE